MQSSSRRGASRLPVDRLALAPVTSLALVLVLLLTSCTASAATSQTRAHPTPTATLSAAWNALEARPLVLPTTEPGGTCPRVPGHSVTPDVGLVQGTGPAYAFWNQSSAISTIQAADLQTILWYIDRSYTGPALVRGRQLDGPGVLTFHGGLDQLDYHGDWRQAPNLPALRLMGGAAYGTPWAKFQAYTNVPDTGCFAYQVDGVGFSYLIIFLATHLET